MVVRYKVGFEHAIPKIDAIAQRFQELAGFELSIEEFAPNAYSIFSDRLKRDVELVVNQVVELFVFRHRLGYFEWVLVRTLHSLGARIPSDLVPSYARVPWMNLPWYHRWLHR
jgi:hypothetical protein